MALTALEGSATSIALAYNDDLQLASDDVGTLLALRELQKLDLQESSWADAMKNFDQAAAEGVKRLSRLSAGPVVGAQFAAPSGPARCLPCAAWLQVALRVYL